MTISKFKYTIEEQPPPKTVNVGCELATREQIETDCHRLVPANTKVVFLEAPYEVVCGKNGCANYKEIEKLLKAKGYGASWVLHSVWATCNDEIF